MAAVLPVPATPAAPAPAGPWRRALRRLRRRPSAMLGLVVVLAFVALALLAPWVSPMDPIATSWSAIRKAPSAEHWFGTDEIGRDVLSRVIWGTRASLLAGVVSVSISLLIGVPIGMLAGFLGGWVDAVVSRITDAFLACPFLILAIALAAFLGPSLTNAMVAIGVSAAPISEAWRSRCSSTRRRRSRCERSSQRTCWARPTAFKRRRRTCCARTSATGTVRR